MMARPLTAAERAELTTVGDALPTGDVIAKSDLYDAVYAALVVGRMDWWMRQDRVIGDDLAALITDGLWDEATS
jgi:hypothetical protein